MAFNYRKQIEEESPYWGKKRLISARDVIDPIPESINEKEYGSIFGRPNDDKPFFIPYAGWQLNSIHSYLDLLLLLGRVSATHGSCIQNISWFCFGGPIEIVGDRQRYVHQEAVELGQAEQDAYIETVTRFLPEFNAKKIFQTAFRWGKECGDRWYYFEGDQNFGKIEVLDPRRCLYYHDKQVPYRVVGVGDAKMNDDTIQKKKYVLVPEGPQIGEYEDGKIRFIMHFKDGNNIHYGRPDTEHVFITQFREYKDDEFLLKKSANHFTGRAIWEFEDDPVLPSQNDQNDKANDNGYGNFAQEVEDNMTNKSDSPVEFVVTSRPYQSQPSTLFQIQDNIPKGFFDFLNSASHQKIVMAHNWSSKLLGAEEGSSGINNAFWEILEIKQPIIEGHQDKLSTELKQVLDIVGNIYGFENNARFRGTMPYMHAMSARTTQGPTGEGGEAMPETASVKERMDAYGVGVRAGAITPQAVDEDSFRIDLGLPPVGPDVQGAWVDDGGVRRPITLQSKTQDDAEIKQISNEDEPTQ